MNSTRTIRRHGLRGLVALVTIAGSSLVASVASGSTTVPAPTDPPAAASSTEPPMATGTSDEAWERVVPGGDCQCSDGSEYAYYVRTADPTRVVFMLEGGGACWSAETCAPGGPYDPDVGADDDPATASGIFDLVRPDNPVADWSIVFVPYCTGDVHLGNVEQHYGDVTIQHKGAVNATAALDDLARRFPDATDVLVVGASAGSIATPLYAGLAHDRLPEARVTAIGDGSGGYPQGDGRLNTQLFTTWGFTEAMPPWPEAEGIAISDWNFTRLWIVAAEHVPDLTLGRFDFAHDAVQQAFIGLVQADVPDLLASQQANEQTIEDAGFDMASYTAAGDGHTLVMSAGLYEMDEAGVPLAEWMAQLINGETVEDVTCTECTVANTTPPSMTGPPEPTTSSVPTASSASSVPGG